MASLFAIFSQKLNEPFSTRRLGELNSSSIVPHFFSQTKTGKILFCHSSPLRLRAIVLLFCLPECDTWMPRRNSIIRCLDPALWLFWAWLNHYRSIWSLCFLEKIPVCLEQLKSLMYACCIAEKLSFATARHFLERYFILTSLSRLRSFVKSPSRIIYRGGRFAE